MRIIAGKARGHKLLSPKSLVTRPTLDRVKEAMFSSIQMKLMDSVVFDMFAGTGSLGLEAASRGAQRVYLVDKSEETYPLLKENISNLKFSDFCTGLNMDSYEALKFLANKKEVFDIIFIDPPYCREMIPKSIMLISEKNMLNKSGIIVTKIDTIEEKYHGYRNIQLFKSKKYGNTTVCFYKLLGEE